MGLKGVVENLEDVDAKYHDLYSKKGDKYELTGIEGMRTQGDVDRLQSALTKERADHKAAKAIITQLGDHKVEDLLAQLDRIPELEAAAAGKLDESKLETILEGRLKQKLGPLERERNRLASENADLQKLNATHVQERRSRQVQDAVREALGKSQGFVPSATDDALMLAERIFEVTEDGKVLTRDGVGATPGVDAAVWLQEVQPKRSHWWGQTQGGGAAGSRGGGAGGAANPWAAGTWNLTEQGRILRENADRAAQFAKQAGTTVGGPRPSK